MNETTFEFVSILMRYWFLGLIVLILYYLVRNSLQEYMFTRKGVEHGVVHLYWLKMVECSDTSVIGNMVGLRHTNVLGCGKNSDIYLPFDGVSKNHCTIKYKGNDFYVSDMKSYYGTYVNGNEIKKNYKLSNGDVITMGSCSVMLVIEKGDK